MTRRIGSKDCPEALKRESKRLYKEEVFSAWEIKDMLGIDDLNHISGWARHYQQEREAMFANKRSISGRKPIHGSPQNKQGD